MSGAAVDRPPTVDAVAAMRWASLANRLARPSQGSPWLHEEVARRMAERLDWIRLQPSRWAHWAPAPGGWQAHADLQARYPQAEVYIAGQGKEGGAATPETARPTSRWWKPWQRPEAGRLACAVPAPPDGQMDMVWANMLLHMAADPRALMADWHRALAFDGFLMFSCLGPDTLRGLRALYARLGWPPPAHEFTDMHDWGDMLVAAGFAEPVLDMERMALSFDTPQRALSELRELGRNLHPARFGALRGRQWLARLHAAMQEDLAVPGEGGRLVLEFEIVYGHALKPVPRARVDAETRIDLADMRAGLRQIRR